MVHLRLVVPPDRTTRVLSTLESVRSVCNIVRLERTARRPDGDLVLCDVAREDASLVIDSLCGLGIDEHGSIAVEEIDTAIPRWREKQRVPPQEPQGTPSSGRRSTNVRRTALSSPSR